MLTMDEARARVAKGAAHLDIERPGWHDQIDEGSLTLHDTCNCIVGQLARPQASRTDSLGGGFMSLWITFHGSREAGLFAHDYDEYARLQDAWIEAIADRRLSQTQATAPTLDAVVPVARQPMISAPRVVA